MPGINHNLGTVLRCRNVHLLAISALVITTLWSLTSRALADELTGRTGAAEASTLGVLLNPANAAYVRRAGIMLYPSLVQRKELFIRYPGAPPINKTSIGPSIFEIPTVVPTSQNPSSRFGWTVTQIAPPIGPINYKLSGLPVVLLDQVNFADIKAKVSLLGLLGGLVYFKPTPDLAFGLGGSYLGAKINADLTEGSSDGALAKIEMTMINISTIFGVRYNPTPSISLGLSSKIFTSNQQNLRFSAATVEGSSGSAPSQRFLSSILGGIQWKISDVWTVASDVEYTQADATQESVSLVDFKTKPKDVYDTVAFRIGSETGDIRRGRVLLGFAYEPANVGPGSRGEDGKIGFGTIDVIMIYSGLEQLKPYTLGTASVQKVFSPVKRPVKGQKKKKDPEYDYFYQWVVGIGVGYQQASLGIDAEGELPGAYLQKKLYLPVQVGYQF